MSGYFNDNERYVCDWLTRLYPDATVECASIADITTVGDFKRAHFFAGIGGWEYALQLAGWPSDREVWTGSCPCQPFSSAGKQKGTDDERHLWPEFLRLIRERRPATIFGEQVASPLGRTWLAGVRADLEALGYAVGGADLCAASVGAPHIRQRLYWVADSQRGTAERYGFAVEGTQSGVQEKACERERVWHDSGDGGNAGGLGHTNEPRSQGRVLRLGEESSQRSPWTTSSAIPCADGKTRRIPVEPEFFPLAHGIPGRVGRLRAYGNAIVPQVAAEFVRAFLESEP